MLVEFASNPHLLFDQAFRNQRQSQMRTLWMSKHYASQDVGSKKKDFIGSTLYVGPALVGRTIVAALHLIVLL